MPKRVLKGTVVSDKADKTISVLVTRVLNHPVYHKIVRKSKKYAVHDELNQFKVGQKVEIIESAPISKTKKWKVLEKESADSTVKL
jgi:small subunit ribosomal protein S17